MGRAGLCALVALSLFVGRPTPAGDGTRPDTLFAASSLAVVLDELAPEYHKATGRGWRVQYAASGTLARQIEAGAPADAFICADPDWMDFLGQRDLLARGSRIDLLGNRLVLITPADSLLTLDVGPGFPLAAALGDGHLALGDPESVPAGRYARAALQALGVWPQVSDRVVRADSVRSALAFVERGDAPLGIVYYTDARDDPRVRIAGTFPTGTHPPVIYPLALLRDHQAGSEALSAFLQGTTARAAFERHGFTVLR